MEDHILVLGEVAPARTRSVARLQALRVRSHGVKLSQDSEANPALKSNTGYADEI